MSFTIPGAQSAVADDVRLRSWLVGERLQSVSYARLQPASDESVEAVGTVDEIDGFVDLTFESGKVLRTTWGTPPASEGLFLSLLTSNTHLRESTMQVAEMTGSSHWAPMVGKAVTQAALVWSLAGFPLTRRPWALRIWFEAQAFVIALGSRTGVNADITYSATDLVVIFDALAARAYRAHEGFPALQ